MYVGCKFFYVRLHRSKFFILAYEPCGIWQKKKNIIFMMFCIFKQSFPDLFFLMETFIKLY